MNHYYTQITVTDNGIGMSNETLNKLFRIDTNLNLTTQGTANEKGTGLGLIICKEFIEKHGGNIQVTSKLDKGSQFKIILPFKKTEKFD